MGSGAEGGPPSPDVNLPAHRSGKTWCRAQCALRPRKALRSDLVQAALDLVRGIVDAALDVGLGLIGLALGLEVTVVRGAACSLLGLALELVEVLAHRCLLGGCAAGLPGETARKTAHRCIRAC